jgi:hypothetical protein
LDSLAGLGNSFKAKKLPRLGHEASFQAEVMRELARLANAPASSYEVMSSRRSRLKIAVLLPITFGLWVL